MTPKAELRPSPLGDDRRQRGAGPAAATSICRRPAGFVACPVYERDLLASGNRLAGPALIDQLDATTLILPGQRATVDAYRNLLIELGECGG